MKLLPTHRRQYSIVHTSGGGGPRAGQPKFQGLGFGNQFPLVILSHVFS